jgi:mono/diheme cytochrome c family protein
MRNAFRALGPFALILYFLSEITAPAFAEDAPAGDAAAGKRIYMAVGCFECHGRVGQGGHFKAPVPSIAHTQLPYDAFAMQLRQPSQNMPTYAASILPDKDVADIFAYVQSLPGPRDLTKLPDILMH